MVAGGRRLRGIILQSVLFCIFCLDLLDIEKSNCLLFGSPRGMIQSELLLRDAVSLWFGPCTVP